MHICFFPPSRSPSNVPSQAHREAYALDQRALTGAFSDREEHPAALRTKRRETAVCAASVRWYPQASDDNQSADILSAFAFCRRVPHASPDYFPPGKRQRLFLCFLPLRTAIAAFRYADSCSLRYPQPSYPFPPAAGYD